jgi:hypothetical protein
MPYGVCDGCNRLFAIDRETHAPGSCPVCRTPLRSLNSEEGRDRFRSATKPSPPREAPPPER